MLHSCMKPSVLKQFKRYNGVLAQLGEHLPYKQRVIGSSPIGPTNLRVYAGVAELADAQDLKSCEGKTSYRFDSGRRQSLGAASLCFTGFAAFFFFTQEVQKWFRI